MKKSYLKAAIRPLLFLIPVLLTHICFSQSGTVKNITDETSAMEISGLEVAEEVMGYFPNDSTGEILHANLNFSKEHYADIVIRDLSGNIKTLIPGKLFTAGRNPISLSVHHLQAGEYSFIILNADKIYYLRKFRKL